MNKLLQEEEIQLEQVIKTIDLLIDNSKSSENKVARWDTDLSVIGHHYSLIGY